jgi:hypothetical protein
MSGSNSWAEFAAIYRSTQEAYVEGTGQGRVEGPLAGDAKEAFGYGIRARRSRDPRL